MLNVCVPFVIISVGICTMSDSAGQLYTINSVKVHFPCRAYPSQLSMMDKVRVCFVLCIHMTVENVLKYSKKYEAGVAEGVYTV